MKSAKQVKQTFLQNFPVLDPFSPCLKKKEKLKREPEPMVLITSDTPENFAKYAVDIPSVNKDRMLDEMDMLKNITVHLNQIVQTMEHVYTMDDDTIKEEKETEETLPPEHREDMVCFLIFCSQLTNQLDIALREERQILESLLKWFEKEVQIMEELGEEEIIPDSKVPEADKNITDNINKLMNRIQRLEELKGRVQELPRYVRVSTPREKRKTLGLPPSVVRDPKSIIEELVMKHASEDVINMAQVFQDESGAPQTVESMNNRMVEIMRIFERQTNKLHRVANEQDVLEGKLQKIQRDFRKLAEEKQIMEDELQKMKSSDITQQKPSGDTRKKLLAKLEKEKAKAEGAQPEKRKRSSVSQKVKDSEAVKMKEDLAKAEANIQYLQREKKILEEKLQKVLEEADAAKIQLAEIPPNIPDFEFTYTSLEESEKDTSKKRKKGTKLKGKPSATDRTVQKQTKVDSVKPGETLPGKAQEISTVSQAKDVKDKKKGADLSEIESSSLQKIPSAVSEKLPKQPGKSAIPSKTDAKGVIKPKDSAEFKKKQSVVKGTGKEPRGSAVTLLPPLPPDKKLLLPDSTDQQTESVETTSQKQKKMLPPIIMVELEEETLPVIEPESADLVSSHLIEPEVEPKSESKEFMGESESLTLEEDATVPRTSLITGADSTGRQEEEIKDLIDEGLLRLEDHLTELKRIPETETLAKLLLEPSKGMEVLSDAQKLQLINQLIAPDGQQQAQFPLPVEEGQIVDEEQRERKKRILADIASTLNVLNQTQAEAGQTEEEINEMAQMRKILLAGLESNLKDLQKVSTVSPTQQELENKLSELTRKRSLLISSMELNLKNLKEAQAIAATQPSEMSKKKVKELLQERAALTACLETNEEELQRVKSQEAVLAGKVKHEEGINELSEKRNMLLAELEKNQNDLQEGQALAATEPSSANDEKIKELTEQRKLLAASLEENQQKLERAQSYVPDLGEESKLKQKEIELSETRKALLDNLKSNLKDLQEAQALAAIEPSAMIDEKIKDLTEQRKRLAASLETNLQDLQKLQGYVPDPEEESRLKDMEINEQSEKKRLLQEKLESNLRNLQQTQMLATAQPDKMNKLKLQELIEERKHLTTELEAAVHAIQGIQHEKELNELSQRKQLLLKNMESNLKDLIEAQALAAAEPGSIIENKLQELTEQRKHLAADLDATLHNLEELQHQDKIAKDPELELQELSDKKQLLMEKLESTLKELQQAQALAAAEPGVVSEKKLQELTEQRRQLTAEIESAVLDMQEIQFQNEILKAREKEVPRLIEKKQLLMENVVSTLKELQEAQAAAAAQPGSISEDTLQVLREKGRRLTADLEAAVHDIKTAKRLASERAELVTPGEQELSDLSERRQILLQNLTAHLKELEQIQALASSEPDSFSENEIQELNEQRKLLSVGLDTILEQIKETEQCHVPERPKMPDVLKMDLNQLSQHKNLFLESLESNLKDLQDAQTLAATQPGTLTEQKVQELTEERRLLSAGLQTVVEDIEDAENQTLDMDAIMRTREIILDELYQKEQLIWDSLESNKKELQKAEALAAAHPGDMTEKKINELTEQRRLLAAGLEEIMQGIQEAEGLDREKLKILELIDEGLAELSEDRKQLWKNMELNLYELKGSQVFALTEADGTKEEKKQMIAEQKKHLASALEALLQDMEEAQNLISSGQMSSPDGRSINDLFEIKRLESKLDQLLKTNALSDVQLDSMQRKLCELKAKKGLDRWDVSLRGPVPLTKEELAMYGLEDDGSGKLVEKRYLSPYLQKNFRDLQQKMMRDLNQKSMILLQAEKELHKQREDKASLEECLVSIPLQTGDDTTVRYGPDDEQLKKRKVLVAKLEANMRDLQAFHEAQQMRKTNEKLISEGSQLLKPTESGPQLRISKLPDGKKIIPRHDIVIPTVSEQQTKLQKEDIELELRKPFMQQVKRAPLPYELAIQKRDMYNAVEDTIDFNKGVFPALKPNLPQVVALAPLQQANLLAAQKLLHSQQTVPSQARFHEYSVQPPRPVWEGRQLPATDYLRKLMALKKKLLSPELKELLDISQPSFAPAPKSAPTQKKADAMLICGRGYRK